jgi:hypothetical protein
VLFDALKQRMEEMQARLTRLRERHDKKRAMAAWAMSHAQIPRIQAADFSLSLRPCSQRLEIQDEALVPPLFFVPQPPRLDRAGLSSVLKRGETVAGAVLVQGDAGLPQPMIDGQLSKIAPGPRIDKASLAIATPRRFRDKAHLRAVSAKPCLICGRQPSHAHHLKFAQSHGLSQKVSDEFVVPLCAIHHDELHRATTELEWWRTQGIDPLPVASELWKNARLGSNPERTAAPPSPPNSSVLAATEAEPGPVGLPN